MSSPVKHPETIGVPMQSPIKRVDLTDALMVMPYAIFPRADLPPKLAHGESNIAREADAHHAAIGRKALLAGDDSMRALRYARVQWTMYDDHHHGYHGNWLLPKYPETRFGKFISIGMEVALCLPPRCVAFKPVANGMQEKPTLVPTVQPLSRAHRELMWERGDIWIEQPAAVNTFLAAFVVERGLPALHTEYDKKIKKHFRDDPRRFAEPLIVRMTELVTKQTGLSSRYDTAKQQHLVPPDSPATAKLLIAERILETMNMLDGPTGYNFKSDSPRSMILRQLEAPSEPQLAMAVNT